MAITHAYRSAPIRLYTHSCIDCGAYEIEETKSRDAAIQATRAKGWQMTKDYRWRCPEHRTQARPKVRPNTQPKPVAAWGTLSASFLERQAEINADYRRRMDEREAREAELREAVYAQGRRTLPDAQERALADRNYRAVQGFHQHTSKVAS